MGVLISWILVNGADIQEYSLPVSCNADPDILDVKDNGADIQEYSSPISYIGGTDILDVLENGAMFWNISYLYPVMEVMIMLDVKDNETDITCFM